jgi:hypothetical protein
VPGARLSSRARRRRLLAAMLTAAFVVPASAQAATITAFPQTSSVDLAGVASPTTVELLRNGIVIARAPGATGNVNHGDACWSGFTPEIRVGDTIRAAGTSMVVQDAGVISFATDATTGDVTVTGSGGPGLPSAVTVLAGSPLSATPTGDPTWTATVPAPGAPATGAEARYTVGDGVTVISNPAGVPNPATGCPPFNVNAATVVDADHLGGAGPVITAANVGLPLTIGGPFGGAAPLTASLGGANATPSSSNGTWSAQFSPAQLAALPDGPLVAGIAGGATLGILKDTTAPDQPTSTPPPGRYLNAPTVSLSAEPGSTIHFTVDGSAPTSASPVYTAPIRVGSSSTIHAFAVDPLGNAGSAAALAYQLGPGAGGSGTNPGNPNNPNNPGGGNSSGPKKPGSARITVLKVSKRQSLKRLRKLGLGVGVQLGSGTGAVRFMVYRRMTLKHRRALHLVASVVRAPSSSRYRTRLNARSLGLVRVGVYQLKVVPGLTRTTLDIAAARTIFLRVVR